MPAPGVLHRGDVVSRNTDHFPSRTFDLATTFDLGTPKKIVVNDGRNEVAPNIPRLVRVRSWDYPFSVLVRQAFPDSGAKPMRYGVPGGFAAGLVPGELTLVAYGAVEVFAYTINARAVTAAEVEVIAGISHVPMVPPLTDEITVSPGAGDEPGDWTAFPLAGGWQPGGRPRLDIVTLGEPIEFAFFDSQSVAEERARFTVDGVLPGGTMHPAVYQLFARHPGGGDAEDRTGIATWSRGEG